MLDSQAMMQFQKEERECDRSFQREQTQSDRKFQATLQIMVLTMIALGDAIALVAFLIGKYLG